MKQIISYVADDGKSFNSEEECKLYENILFAEQLDGILFFDDDFKQIFFNPKLDFPFCDIIDNSFYIVIKSMEQWQKFIDLLGEHDRYYESLIDIAGKAGIYFFSDSKEAWVSLEEEKNYLEDIENNLGNF